MAEEFCDISSHQEGADLSLHAAAGYRRVLVKATQGTRYVNPYFAPWWRLAGTLELARGAYHYATPSRTSGRAEAEHFVRTVLAAGFGDRDWACLDTEDTDEAGPKAAEHAVDFCLRMVELGFPRGVVYSGTWYLEPAGLTAAMLPGGWRQLHVAHYGKVADSRVPLPPGWGRGHVVARQYTSKAVQPGIPGGSDANRVVREWLDGGTEEIVTPEDREDIADRVLAKLRDEIFEVQPQIRQAGKAGVVIGAAYNKIGDAQKVLGEVSERVGLVGIGVGAARQEVAVLGGRVDALVTAVGAGPAVTEQGECAGGHVERMMAALLDHLGVEWPPTSGRTDEPVPAPPQPLEGSS